MSLDSHLLAVLACPVCRGDLAVVGEQEGLSCVRCAKVYPIRDEIPVMLAEEAVAATAWAKGQREAASQPRPGSAS